ncbi:ABC transporter ATP-binding protein [Paucilactobacillus suebicus]|nr:ABC transporter ATP-binding protein [Paucilactobacillus suebicus]
MRNHRSPKGLVDTPHNFWGTAGRLFKYMGRWIPGMVISVILAAASVILSINAPKILGKATTEIFNGMLKGYKEMKMGMHVTKYPIDFDKILHIIIVVAVLYGLSAIFSVVQQIVMTRISQRVVYQLRKDFKAKMQRVPVSYYDTHSNGDIMSRAVNDMDNIAGTLQQSLIQIVTSLLTFFGVLYIMFTISWKLTLVALITIPLSLLVVGVIAPRSQKLFARQQATLGLINDQVEETYAGHTVVRTFNHEQDEVDKFEKQNEVYYKSSWKAQFFSTLIYPMMNFIKNLGYLMVAVLGTIEVAHGQISLGNVQAFLQYTNQFSQPITQIANLTNTIQATIASAERIFAVIDEPEMIDSTQKIEDQPANDMKIAFKNVSFSYDQNPLIKDFSLDAQRNHMVAIVGPTGAGKTTIINLLERFYDIQGGDIYLDGTETRNMSREEVRRHFAMVLQDTWLFTGSIYDNIKYGREDASKEDVFKAAQDAHADSFIRQLPEGYDTILDESASNISQGQRQLLTIARAFVADPEILILDEATSSVDTRTESLIQSAMNNLQRNRTSFVVAHRLSTIRHAEKIIVMNHGQIVETGNHNELMDQNGFYADLYNSQFLGNQI